MPISRVACEPRERSVSRTRLSSACTPWIDDSKIIFTARLTTITRSRGELDGEIDERTDKRSRKSARRDATTNEHQDARWQTEPDGRRTTERPNHRVRRSYTPKVFEEAPAEGDRLPPNVADPARCTESSARPAVIYPRVRSLCTISTVLVAGGTIIQSPQVSRRGKPKIRPILRERILLI